MIAWWGADGPDLDRRTPTVIVSHTTPDDVTAGGVYTFIRSPREAAEVATGLPAARTSTCSARASAPSRCALASSTRCASTSLRSCSASAPAYSTTTATGLGGTTLAGMTGILLPILRVLRVPAIETVVLDE